jgi:hypothetical protein
MTVLAEEFVDVFDDPVTLANFPPTFETLTPFPQANPNYLINRDYH